MTALMGTFVKVNTMADGTPRVTLDMECTLAELAALGVVPGTPFALARITNEAAQTPPVADKPKGGELARLAGIWCNDPMFWRWAKVTGVVDAVSLVYVVCGIESRAELDHDDAAATKFQELIRLPYMAYMNEQGAPNE